MRSRVRLRKWYDDVEDADAQENVRKTYSTGYDPAGRVATVGDGDYEFEYTYSVFGNLTFPDVATISQNAFELRRGKQRGC
jgi:hypothetical protein